MKITLCGSVKFAKKWVEIFHRLENMGHEPLMHEEIFEIADETSKEMVSSKVEHHEIKIKNDYIRWWYECIKKGDSILVLNFDKNGIKNYVGGNTLMEIGFAHILNKKIFLLNPIPEKVGYVEEIKAMQPVILNGDLKKIV